MKKLIGYIIEIISLAIIFKISSTGGFEYFDSRFWFVFVSILIHGIVRYILGYFEGRRTTSAKVMEDIMNTIESEMFYQDYDEEEY